MGVRAVFAAPIAAALLLLAGCGGGGSSGAGPGAGSAQTGTATAVDDGTPFACPDPQDNAPMTGTDTLPTGATAALLCFHDNRFAWVPPRGRLLVGLDDLVRVVNAQRVHDQNSDDNCGGVGAPAWRMVLRYPDGTRTIGGDNGGCWDLTVGSSQRFGSHEVFDAFTHALLRQRHQDGPGDHQDVPTVTCPDHVRTDDAFSPLADAGHFANAVVCPTNVMKAAHEIRPSAAQLRTLRHDFATADTRRTHLDGPSDCHALPSRVTAAIVGVDGWGDPFTVLTTCDTYRILRPTHSHYLFARMLPSTARMLGRLLAS